MKVHLRFFYFSYPELLVMSFKEEETIITSVCNESIILSLKIVKVLRRPTFHNTGYTKNLNLKEILKRLLF